MNKIFAIFAFGASLLATNSMAQDANFFDYICVVKKDIVTGLPTDGNKIAPYEEEFERRISFDLETMEFFEYGDVEYLTSANENELVLYQDEMIMPDNQSKNFTTMVWKIDRKTGKSVEDTVYYDSISGNKITGTIHTESDCTLAPFTEF